MIEALYIQVRGIVQGVGFRPFIYRLAQKYLIKGWVLNAVDGVFIHAEGEAKHLDEFVIEISEQAPAAAQVQEINLKEVPLEDFDSFEIRFSEAATVEKTTLISPDLATCDECVHELFDKNNRRFRYPFINCTNCGPRFTIVDALPYDRKNTSMRDFPLCPPCHHEYNDPGDRRFHAQPNACFTCGPQVSWYVAQTPRESIAWSTDRETSDTIFAQAISALRAGKILAVKGLGGFHLVCDAANEKTLALLRERKKRKGQAFAVMVRDGAQAQNYCLVNDEEAHLLTSAAHPIVLLKKRSEVALAQGLADGLSELGVMLPYTPIQHILAHDFDGMLVMTSANVHDEPIVTDDETAYQTLALLADAFLGHNRAIEARYDDSVMRVIDAGSAGMSVQVIRRARGFAPVPLALPAAPTVLSSDQQRSVPSIFATGPEQKNTFCLTRGGEAFVSPHIGDMENAETFEAWLAMKKRFERLFDSTPTQIVCDKHPEYLTSKWAHRQEAEVIEVQHHHAHIVSVMAENNVEAPVVGIAFDGTGYGADKALWGGEVLLCNEETFERFANFTYIPMPGGAAAITHPLRMAYGVLWTFDLLDHPGAQSLFEKLGSTADLCGTMIEKGLNTPFTSSVGRLFDAASALLGICTEPRYEGEGAILLEAAIGAQENASAAYTIELVKNTATANSTAQDTSVVLFDAGPVFEALLDDLVDQVPLSVIAQRFHDAFVRAVVEVGQTVRALYGLTTLALSGGVWMNRYLLEHSIEALTQEGFTVALNRELPPNDACISFGQAVVALALNKEKERGR